MVGEILGISDGIVVGSIDGLGDGNGVGGNVAGEGVGAPVGALVIIATMHCNGSSDGHDVFVNIGLKIICEFAVNTKF